MGEWFRKAASSVACALGSAWAFFVAILLVAIWAAVGPFVHYSEDWQLVINTGTTIATFLMMFALQNSQNRDTKAINIKLDELLRAIEGARTGLATVGDLSDKEIEKIEGEFRSLATDARRVGVAAERLENVAPAVSPRRRSVRSRKRSAKVPVEDR